MSEKQLSFQEGRRTSKVAVPDEPCPDETVVSAEEASQIKRESPPLLPTNISAADQSGSDQEKPIVFYFAPPPLSLFSFPSLPIALHSCIIQTFIE